MPRVSRIRVDTNNLQFFLNNFWSVLTLLEDKDQVKNFLKALLTHTEMKMLAKRIQISKMLLEGYGYKDIRSYVKVTDPTISRISNILQTDGEGLKLAIQFLQKIESETDKERMRATPDLKKQYGIYFLPEKIAGSMSKVIKNQRKRKSAKKAISL